MMDKWGISTAALAWLALFVGGVFEAAWALGLKYTRGFSRLWPSVLVIAAMSISVFLLSIAMKSLLAGVSYAVWTGIGVVATVIGGYFLFGEFLSTAQMLSISLILIGIIGLRVL